jgi:hypothetical protein
MSFDMNECKLNGSRLLLTCLFSVVCFIILRVLPCFGSSSLAYLQFCVNFCRILLVLVYILIDQCCVDPIYGIFNYLHARVIVSWFPRFI